MEILLKCNSGCRKVTLLELTYFFTPAIKLAPNFSICFHLKNKNIKACIFLLSRTQKLEKKSYQVTMMIQNPILGEHFVVFSSLHLSKTYEKYFKIQRKMLFSIIMLISHSLLFPSLETALRDLFRRTE